MCHRALFSALLTGQSSSQTSHCQADDTQLLLSFPPDDSTVTHFCPSLTSLLSTCTYTPHTYSIQNITKCSSETWTFSQRLHLNINSEGSVASWVTQSQEELFKTVWLRNKELVSPAFILRANSSSLTQLLAENTPLLLAKCVREHFQHRISVNS